jgi:hypothetical protein
VLVQHVLPLVPGLMERLAAPDARVCVAAQQASGRP